MARAGKLARATPLSTSIRAQTIDIDNSDRIYNDNRIHNINSGNRLNSGSHIDNGNGINKGNPGIHIDDSDSTTHMDSSHPVAYPLGSRVVNNGHNTDGFNSATDQQQSVHINDNNWNGVHIPTGDIYIANDMMCIGDWCTVEKECTDPDNCERHRAVCEDGSCRLEKFYSKSHDRAVICTGGDCGYQDSPGETQHREPCTMARLITPHYPITIRPTRLQSLMSMATMTMECRAMTPLTRLATLTRLDTLGIRTISSGQANNTPTIKDRECTRTARVLIDPKTES